MSRSIPTGKYRSKLEAQVAKDLGSKYKYEAEIVSYLQPKDYLPDFTFTGKKDKVYIEVKGFFRAGDSSKYKAIRDTIEDLGYTFVMVFSNPYKPVRKGSKTTYAKWAEKNLIPWYSASDLHELKLDYK